MRLQEQYSKQANLIGDLMKEKDKVFQYSGIFYSKDIRTQLNFLTERIDKESLKLKELGNLLEISDSLEQSFNKSIRPNIDPMFLLGVFLNSCSQITESLVFKAELSSLTEQDGETAREIARICNTILTVYFYRKESCFTDILGQTPLSKEQEEILSDNWKKLEKLTNQEIAELTIGLIQSSSIIRDSIN